MSQKVAAGTLCCSECGSTLEDTRDELTCTQGHRFPVVGGIPRFSPASTYADSFGFEWTRWPTVQLDGATSHESEVTFATKTGLTPEDVAGKRVLDVGCGMGRFSDVVARWGASSVVATDISRAVEAAAENLRVHDSAMVAQADLGALPLQEESFDIVFSLGVLHHTPDTYRALREIARFVKPGGLLSVWVYWRKLQIAQPGGEILRLFSPRMNPRTLLRVVEWITPKAHAAKQRLSGLERVVNALVPVSGHPDPEWRILDTFDWYSPRYQWKHSYLEVERWFRQLGFVDITRGGCPVSVRGRRPLGEAPQPRAQPSRRGIAAS